MAVFLRPPLDRPADTRKALIVSVFVDLSGVDVSETGFEGSVDLVLTRQVGRLKSCDE
jgi:hypothetical protein